MVPIGKILAGGGIGNCRVLVSGTDIGDTKNEITFTAEDEKSFLNDITQLPGVNAASWVTGHSAKLEVNVYNFDLDLMADILGYDTYDNSGVTEIGPKFTQTTDKYIPITLKGPVYPNVETAVVLASGGSVTPAFDAVETHFSVTVSNIGNTIKPGTVTVVHYNSGGVTQETFTDADKDGILTGNDTPTPSTGTVFYPNGKFTFSFHTAPAASDYLRFSYTYLDNEQFVLFMPLTSVTGSPGGISFGGKNASVYKLTFEAIADEDESRHRLYKCYYDSVTLDT